MKTFLATVDKHQGIFFYVCDFKLVCVSPKNPCHFLLKRDCMAGH